ncbi:MAG: alpha/beta hydrolase [Myxococcales bacterium]|nr:alpha/beta hydrolase [Myxococcales bacterium]
MPRIDDVVGRYVYVELDGVEYRVYYEEAGQGIPLLCQHTAGSDGRQWRHLLADKDITQNFRVIAWDLPYHGKSIPPDGVDWWKEDYRLERHWFMRFVLELAQTLGVDRPVFMGCSMGGQLAIDLAFHHPAAFRAVVGIESGLDSGDFDASYFNHPRISNANKGAMMMSIMSPMSPEHRRRETAWCYAQGGPPVFRGDLNYYFEYDLNEKARQINTDDIPIYLLTGEYDWSVTPEMTKKLVAEVPGATFKIMEKVGHFPMSENPEVFKGYLMPYLDEIRGIA